ncbi:MAG: precorrin-3B C(17)-methyltransferase [Rhizobiaceae bacterium]
MSAPCVIALSKAGFETGLRIARETGGVLYGLEGRTGKADVQFSDTRKTLQDLFEAGKPIIAVMASGAVIRILAPVLKDKRSEPPVIAVSEDGGTIVPLLGGHHGANDLACLLADRLGGVAAITTAGDLRFALALDEPPEGWTLINPQNAKTVMAELLDGRSCRVEGNASDLGDWIRDSRIETSAEGDVRLCLSTARTDISGDLDLVFVPRVHVLGMGCERGVDAREAISLAEDLLRSHDICAASLAAVSSIDVKADETAIHAVGQHFGVPVRFFSAEALEKETPRASTRSEIVFAEVGTHGVAENAALALAGDGGTLVVPKQKSRRVTAAIARAPRVLLESQIMENGKSRGTLFVVGIGPGKQGWRSPEVSAMISASTDLVGYSLYLDLIADISQGKTRHDFDLGKEEDRVRHAMELAGKGRDVALVCSGDAGIYAMATLVFELLEKGGLSDGAQRIAIEVSPGISALQAAAARAGAPLGHDFCTISLSDLLTPWPDIQRRVKAAAEGDFVIAFYNPVSKRRRTQLAHAREVLLQHRPDDTPVILATNLGREGETVRIVPLAELDVDEVDMLTVVLVGSSQTRTVRTGDGRNWVYTPRGYAAKEGSILAGTGGQAR